MSKRTEVPSSALKLKSQQLDTWGDICVFTVDAADMPKDGEAYVMQRLNYSTQPQIISRQPDGSGLIEMFFSRGD